MNEEEALNTAGPSAPTPGQEGEAPLSKNQQKKLAKRARFQEHKLEKRVQEKERRRERNKALKEGYAAGTLSEAERAAVEARRELQRARKIASKGKESDVFPGAVVIDLGFDDLMTDGEITSMASQLTYLYSVNRTAKRPFAAVLHTSFGPTTSPRLWAKLGKSMWPRWTRMHFWDEGVDVVSRVLKEATATEATTKETTTREATTRETTTKEDTAEETTAMEVEDSASATADSFTPQIPDTSTQQSEEQLQDLARYLTGPRLPDAIPPSSHLVYLSADSEEELTTLSPNEIYVIGGIVDRNRHKMLCQNKAVELGIRTARLPIGSFIENMPTRKVLTVNQVFEILVQYNVQGDWKKAFETVIPSRKFYTGREEKKVANQARNASEAPEVVESAGQSSPQEG